jgi:hypothetical protein
VLEALPLAGAGRGAGCRPRPGRRADPDHRPATAGCWPAGPGSPSGWPQPPRWHWPSRCSPDPVYRAGRGRAGADPAPPVIWLTGIGLLVAGAGRGPALASGAIAAIWLTETIFAGQAKASPLLRDQYLFAPVSHLPPGPWAANRAGLALAGTAALAVTALLLARPARLLAVEPS